MDGDADAEMRCDVVVNSAKSSHTHTHTQPDQNLWLVFIQGGIPVIRAAAAGAPHHLAGGHC